MAFLGGNPRLSNNGKYVIYVVENIPVGKRTTVIQATDAQWKMEYTGGLRDAVFTSDSKSVLFIKGNDSLVRLTLRDEH